MAGIDYVSCKVCGKRLFYDGEWAVREYISTMKVTVGLTCDHCVKKLEKKIKTLEKHDRRKH